ncbi:MAG: hypothetical protein ABW123_28830 [Cystobacter sp.]
MNTNSVSPTSPPLLVPGTRVGRWRVLEPVGAGGQGTVYRVEDTHHPGPVHALKFSPKVGTGRAEREVALVKTRAAHPHVVGFRDCVRAPAPLEGGLGLVMEWVPGLALDAWAETRGATFRQLASMGATVAHESESWDQPLFEGEQPSPEHAGDAPGWRIQRPAKPRPSWTFAPPRTLHGERVRPGPRWSALAAMVLLAVVGMTLVHGNARRARGWTTGMKLDANASSTQEAPVPLKNQKQAPCTAKLEVEFSGACWLRLWNQPPNCPPQTVPYEDKCLLPVQKPPHRLPTSIDGGTED